MAQKRRRDEAARWRKRKSDPAYLARSRARVAAATQHRYRALKSDPVAYAEHLSKQRARGAVRRAVKSGRIIRPTRCEECGAGVRTEAHHTDYDKPLEVHWLCRPGHAHCHNSELRRAS
jgi:hypothetical protein